MAINYNESLNNLDKQQQQLQSKLTGSSTAFTPNIEPTEEDLSTQGQLMKVIAQRQNITNKQLQEKWYGTEKEQASDELMRKPEDSVLKRAINLIGMPLYALTGVLESATGKGYKKNVVENVISNIEERHEGFGSLLSKFGTPTIASMPLGLAMDFVFDPINVATLGSASLLGKVGKGVLKAGLPGAKAALAVKGLEYAKNIPMGVAKKESIEKAFVGAADKYRNLTGETVNDLIKPGSAINLSRDLWQQVDKATEGTPVGKFFNFFTGKNKEWFDNAKKYDKAAREADVFRELPGDTTVEDIPELFNVDKLFEEGKNITPYPKNKFERMKFDFDKQINDAKEIMDDPNAINVARAKSSAQLSDRLAAEGMNDEATRDFIKIFNKMNEEKTGWNLYDNAAEFAKKVKVGNYELGSKIMNGYSDIIDLFKTSVIGGDPIRYLLMSVAGNTTMTHMAGIRFWDKAFRSDLGNALKFTMGKVDRTFIDKFIKNEKWLKIFEENPYLFTATFGIDPEAFIRSATIGRRLEGEAVGSVAGKMKNIMGEKVSAEVAKQEKAGLKQISKMTNPVEQAIGNMPAPGTISTRIPTPENLRSTTLAGEFLPVTGEKTKRLREIRNKLDQGTADWKEKAYYWVNTKPLEFASKPDQAFKLGLASYMTDTGLSEGELKLLSNFIEFKPEDIVKVPGRELWKVEPIKALEAVNDVYMNYAAMPGIVKVLRTMPFIGNTFSSFMYGMTNKTLRTMLANPAAFNKVEFAINELQGNKSPLEKQALNDKYYNFLNKRGMVRVPFIFKDNPIYVNLGNAIPYYTLNIFQDPERFKTIQEKTMGSEILKAIDKTPFLKTPEGQMVLDYFIQPLLIRDTNPRGMFDQPLWPVNATVGEKALYAGRAAVEPFIPKILSAGGLIHGATSAPEWSIEAVPSFRWRQLARAIRGETSIGKVGKEAPAARTARTIASTAGLPYYSVPLYYSNKK